MEGYGYDEAYEAEVMGGSAEELATAIIGHRIVSVEKGEADRYHYNGATILTLDNGTRVRVSNTDDCCAFTEVEQFKFLEGVDNAVTSVETKDGYRKWFIYAGDVPVVDLDVAWSPGNPYYYGFGFSISVEEIPA